MIYRDWLGQEIRVGSPVLYAISEGHFAKLVWGEVLEIIPVANPSNYFGGFRNFKLKIQPKFENIDVLSEEAYGGRAVEYKSSPSGIGRGEFRRAELKPSHVQNVEKVTVFPLPAHVIDRIEAQLDERVRMSNEKMERRRQP